MLKKEGKGSRSKASESLGDDEIQQLWENGALGCSGPETLFCSFYVCIWALEAVTSTIRLFVYSNSPYVV